jgi:Tol biopolymer transport system component
MTASVTTVLTLDGREVSHFYDGQVDNSRWSPVEDVLAINHGVELHIVDSGGQTTKRIHPPFEIEAVHGWSPDGSHVLVRAMDAFDLWAIDVVSGGSVRLTDTPTVHELETDWSPDGSHIAYTADCGDDWTPDAPCPWSIWTVRSDGSERRRLTAEDGHTARGPTWAPDGKHLAYTQGSLTQTSNLGNGTVYVSDAEGIESPVRSPRSTQGSHSSWTGARTARRSSSATRARAAQASLRRSIRGSWGPTAQTHASLCPGRYTPTWFGPRAPVGLHPR